jgi:hypothetical protein
MLAPRCGEVRGWFRFPLIRFVQRLDRTVTCTSEGRPVPLAVYLEKQGYGCGVPIPARRTFFAGVFRSSVWASGLWYTGETEIRLPDGQVHVLCCALGSWSFEAQDGPPEGSAA